MRRFGWGWLFLGLAFPARAETDSVRHGRIRYVEPGVSIERSTEASVEEAIPNTPFFPGDRLWTDASGRAEIQFESGSLARLDSASKLDYLAATDGRGDVAIRLWAGGLYLRTQGDESIVVDTPGGSVETRQRGVYRVDVAAGEARLSVYEGEATLGDAGNDVHLAGGERSYARRGEETEAPARFDPGEDDVFARWDADRQAREANFASTSRRYLPPEVDPYASELDAHGSWYFQADVGNVWRPYVSAGWRPYYNGRWCWTAYGWTWVPYEAWGWAPFHYGRWGYSASLGWYWIPGAAWGPAWVSWAVGPEYVGWCPLGYRDRPVLLYDNGYRGYAVPRTVVAIDLSASRAWLTARRVDMTAADLARRATTQSPAQFGDMRVLESAQLRPSRDFRVTDARALANAVPRSDASRKPTIGDVVPELRYDNKTTIPPAIPRRSERQDEHSNDRQEQAATPPAGRGSHPTDARGGDRPDPHASDRPLARPVPDAAAFPRSWDRLGDRPPNDARRADPRPASGGAPAASVHPTDTRTPAGDRTRGPTASPSPAAGDNPAYRPEPQAQPRDGSHEVIRQFFQPLSEPRATGDGRSDGGRPARPESVASPRAEPRSTPPPAQTASPRPSTPPTPSAKPRDKDKPHN